MKEEVLGSPSKDKSKGKSRNIEQDKDRVKEMRRIALETLFEYGVRGETMNNIAARVSFSPASVSVLGSSYEHGRLPGL